MYSAIMGCGPMQGNKDKEVGRGITRSALWPQKGGIRAQEEQAVGFCLSWAIHTRNAKDTPGRSSPPSSALPSPVYASSLPLLFLSLCVHMFMWGRMCICVDESRTEVTNVFFSTALHLISWDIASHWTWSWLATELQRATNVHLLSARIMDAYDAWSFTWASEQAFHQMNHLPRLRTVPF